MFFTWKEFTTNFIENKIIIKIFMLEIIIKNKRYNFRILKFTNWILNQI